MRRALALLAAVLLLAGCGAQTGAADAPAEWHARATCTTSATGHCSQVYAHPLGVVPVAQVTSEGLTAITHTYQVTATSFRVRVMRSETQPWANQTLTLSLSAFAPTVVPTPSASATPSTPPTITPPTTGWPDASNTGVPDGVALTAYTGPCTITVANTVIDAKTIACDMDINAPGVVITRSRITGAVNTPDSLTTTAGFTLTDSEVAYPSITAAGRTHVGAVNFTVLRTEVTGGNRGIYCRKNCEVRDSYVHGTLVTSTLHASAIRMSQNATIVHNTLWCSAPDAGEAGCSANLTGYGDFEPVQNNLIQGNLFHATPGGACAYGGSSGGKPYSGQASGIRFIDNVFERGTGGKCGFYFPITDFDPARPGNVWSGNTWTDGTTVPPG